MGSEDKSLYLGVRGGYEEVTPASVYLVSFHFRGQKFFCLEECKALLFQPQCLRDARNLMGLRAGPQGVQGP